MKNQLNLGHYFSNINIIKANLDWCNLILINTCQDIINGRPLREKKEQ